LNSQLKKLKNILSIKKKEQKANRVCVYQLFEYYKSLDVEHFSVLHFLIVHLKGREVENVFVKMLGDDNKKF